MRVEWGDEECGSAVDEGGDGNAEMAHSQLGEDAQTAEAVARWHVVACSLCVMAHGFSQRNLNAREAVR